MPRTLAAIVGAQLKKITKLDNENYTAVVDPTDIHNVYILVRNLPDDYASGEYLYKLTIPNEFPDKAPSLFALTPNGLFELGGQICISIGVFHQTDFRTTEAGSYGWRAAMGLSGFVINGIINAMLHFDQHDHGIRIKLQTPEVKKNLAQKSREYNNENLLTIVKMFDDLKEVMPDLKVWQSAA